ncbi:MAG: peptide deformylase [Minisyncoccia bacterium]|jgi:peptide deformylase
MDEILKIENKKNEKFLRQKTEKFNFKEHSPKEIRALVKSMRETMKKADGVGLSANQIGLPLRLFVAQVPDAQGKPKFYAVFNPEITKISKEMEILEEGCLSVPEIWGPVERHYRLTLTGEDMNGKKLKIKAWGLLARVFQHELDHLNGGLFTDKARELRKRPTSERLIAREERLKNKD